MRWGLAITAVAALAGCGEQAYIQYQGREALTALECEAGYEAAKEIDRNAVFVPTNATGLIVTGLARGISVGARDSAYDACLARVATLQPGTFPPAGTAPLQSTTASATPTVAARPTGCLPGAGPFQGGTGYCIGR